ncbi:1,6-dihydroxycyclohexa-2,4-diene-1-carboxylate dehydrogenase [Streptomyces qinzhouensis]|uniref:1,6-dihydroxycyclohexa-2,4-diene-1-carboxylate dehydrogenase n=1 Tax=Streptomyces qinzhouensis TaxID=2599401 RepID=A0A5B8J352_9ACTN|nr:1,6-dihydroxycyclohexa-2,4-diene-1-carboxylate dehydrogenase [Streptomyces qinzhouensis]QDY75606.1 1,6-dihydroxycyclohexa-2,4-diene-1-carboxylate dehydrogenase [Streptomyces qinzhouensis]
MSVHPGRFAGRKAVVTGAAQGIGLAVARRLAAESADVVLVDRSETVLEEAAALGAAAVLADLETYEGAETAITGALERLDGRIDVLVNNVGGTIWAKPYEHYAPDEIEAEVRRSLFPTLWTTRAVLPHLIARRSGTVVNVSSIATRGIHRIPYSAAKGGVNALTASLAMEAAPYGIRIVAAAAGGTEAPPRRVARGPAPRDDREREWYRRIVDQTVDSTLLKRYGTVAEQAAAICFLASDEASYITGTVLPVGGGDPG